jgi:hypothetical protein
LTAFRHVKDGKTTQGLRKVPYRYVSSAREYAGRSHDRAPTEVRSGRPQHSLQKTYMTRKQNPVQNSVARSNAKARHDKKKTGKNTVKVKVKDKIQVRYNSRHHKAKARYKA